MNVAYLLKILNTESLPELTANMDMPAIDMNLAIWDAIDRGEIKVDEEEQVGEHIGSVRLVGTPEPSSDPDLRSKLLRVIQHYAKNETNINRGRLNTYVKDPSTGQGYAWHDYVMAIEHLIEDGTVIQNTVEVPAKIQRYKDKKGRDKQKLLRPAHKFAFLGLPENGEQNAEWDAKAVTKWIADMDEALLK